MQNTGVNINVIGFGRMELHYAVGGFKKQVFNHAHLSP